MKLIKLTLDTLFLFGILAFFLTEEVSATAAVTPRPVAKKPPTPPKTSVHRHTAIVIRKEITYERYGCEQKTKSFRNDSTIFVELTNVNEGQVCHGIGHCHNGFCTERNSQFGLIDAQMVWAALSRPMKHVILLTCISNSSKPVTSELNYQQQNYRETCAYNTCWNFNPTKGPSPYEWSTNCHPREVFPESGQIHFQVYDRRLKSEVQYYSGQPMKQYVPSVYKEIFIGTASLSLHQLAVANRANQDENKAHEMVLSNGAGRISARVKWLGTIP